VAGTFLGIGRSRSQAEMAPFPRQIETPALSIGYEESGDRAEFPIILLHGFPDDVRAWDKVAPPLVKAGYRVLVPYLGGYGPTRFRDAAAPRMAEQAAIGRDLIDFADALHIERFAVAGYDRAGARPLSRRRCTGSSAGRRLDRRLCHTKHDGPFQTGGPRNGACSLVSVVSPSSHFSDETFNRTAISFDNPDFVDVVIHSYRHRHVSVIIPFRRACHISALEFCTC
jgi:hypothetical protein